MDLRKLEVMLVTLTVSSWFLRKMQKFGVKVCLLAFAQDTTVRELQLTRPHFQARPQLLAARPRA